MIDPNTILNIIFGICNCTTIPFLFFFIFAIIGILIYIITKKLDGKLFKELANEMGFNFIPSSIFSDMSIEGTYKGYFITVKPLHIPDNEKQFSITLPDKSIPTGYMRIIFKKFSLFYLGNAKIVETGYSEFDKIAEVRCNQDILPVVNQILDYDMTSKLTDIYTNKIQHLYIYKEGNMIKINIPFCYGKTFLKDALDLIVDITKKFESI